jgi:hypothetical protein
MGRLLAMLGNSPVIDRKRPLPSPMSPLLSSTTSHGLGKHRCADQRPTVRPRHIGPDFPQVGQKRT